ISGGTPSRARKEFWENGDIPWIKIGNLKGKYVNKSDECITKLGLENSATKLLPRGTILYSIFATLGETGILSIEACTNQAIAGIIINDKMQVSTEYLYYFLKSKKKKVNNIGRGVAQNNINISMLKGFKILLPEYVIQCKMVDIFDKIENIIEIRKAELESLDKLVRARFVELFGNPVINNKGWEQKLLGEITLKIGSGSTPKGGKRVYRENGIAFIRSMNVHSGYFEYKDLAYISDEQAHSLVSVTAKEYDVLLNITGASVARCCVIPSDILPARVNQHVCIIRCKQNISPYFLNYMLIDNNFRELLLRIAGTGATREAITKQKIENLNIILPPIQLQNDFATFVEQVNKSKVEVQKALDKDQLLFDSLMQKYFG
ncbi:MAG: restriction endonuclease subunit S, partial [Lachnospiraceae bacterium oral taxon 082]|nr:restriction endonuclease subunit S [Lachnospiraceae bacterium oral taxon 082]